MDESYQENNRLKENSLLRWVFCGKGGEKLGGWWYILGEPMARKIPGLKRDIAAVKLSEKYLL